MDFFIGVHLFSSLPAIFLGAYVLARKKGDRLHKALGKTWAGLILLACLSSIAIRDAEGNFTIIHLLTLWTFICIVIALFAIRRKRIRLHRGFMIGTYIGLVVAGVFAVALPGRYLYQLLIG